MTKVIEKIERSEPSDDETVVFSFEYFTPKPGHATVDSFINTVTRMAAHGPAFCDITWRPRDPYPALTLELASRMQNEVGVETMMHLTCVGMTLDRIDLALDTARANGVRNILALRGDFLPGQDAGAAADGAGFTSALELVRYIRTRHGNYFGVAVAGYPGAFLYVNLVPFLDSTAAPSDGRPFLELLLPVSTAAPSALIRPPSIPRRTVAGLRN